MDVKDRDRFTALVDQWRAEAQPLVRGWLSGIRKDQLHICANQLAAVINERDRIRSKGGCGTPAVHVLEGLRRDLDLQAAYDTAVYGLRRILGATKLRNSDGSADVALLQSIQALAETALEGAPAVPAPQEKHGDDEKTHGRVDRQSPSIGQDRPRKSQPDGSQ